MGGHDADELLGRSRQEIDPVTVLLHAGQQPDGAFHGIQAGGAADIVILGRVVMENQGDLFVFVFQPVQLCPLYGLVHHGGVAFRHGPVFDGAVRQHIAAGNGNSVQGPVKFRQGHGDGRFHRIEAFGIVAPFFFRGQQGITGQDRYAQFFQFVNGEAAVACVGKFHGADDNVHCGFPVQSKEIGKHLADAGHA